MENLKSKIEKMVAQGYTIQERLTNVVQYFDIELTADNLKVTHQNQILHQKIIMIFLKVNISY